MTETKGRAPGQRSAQPTRRLAAIMFTDLVGYSAMAHRDEVLAIELLELHRAWVREILPRHRGKEIETVGDAFLIEFSGALAAVECAAAIQQRFAEHNAAAPEGRRMELRIGIHLGDIEHKDGKVMGDGVNIASRIHGLAEPGGICVSEDVHHAVLNRPGFQFKSLGTPQLKNIANSLELFQLSISDSKASAPPGPPATARPGAKIGRWLAVGAATAIVVALAGTWLASRKAPSGPPSVAVLPFDNLSAEADSAHFTDGLHDSVIGHLSRVSGLKVISRTSVMGYRGKANLRQIASELGVSNILEGSVQRAGGRLRVTAQLIDTATDTHLWSSEYDRELADVFAVQADIARSVAAAVHARLTPQEQAGIESVPTTNQAAYDLYLRAVLVERAADAGPERMREAIGWLGEAVALDPTFAQAYALLAQLHDYLYWFGFDPSDERQRLVSDNAELALKHDPNLPEAHIAKALHLYHGSRSYEAALRELEIARTVAPGSARVHSWIAPIYRRQGRWDEGLSSYERTTRLDPLNASFLSEYASTLQMLRRYAEAGQAYARLVQLDPQNHLAPLDVAFNRFLQSGDLAPVNKALMQVPAGFDPGCGVSRGRMGMALFERRFDDALAAVRACGQTYFNVGDGQQIPKAHWEAQARWLAGGRRPLAEAVTVRTELEQMLMARPDQPGVRMGMAMTLVMLGEPRRALEEVDRALALMPVSRDALTGATILWLATRVHASAGAEERALNELEQALKLPNGVHAQNMKFDPFYDPLRTNPRFQKLIAEHSPDTASR